MKNILLVMPYGSVGGMEKLAFTFYSKYKSLGFNVKAIKIIGLSNDIIHFGDDEIILSNKDFCEFSKFDRLKFYLSIPQMLKKVILDNNINYTISFGDMANCFSALSNTNEYKVASIHALKSVELNNPGIMGRLFKLSYKTIYKRFNKVVCISKDIKEDLINNFNYKFSNLEVIYNPHNFDYIKQKSNEKIIDPIEIEIFNSDVILFLGRLSVQKSPWHLINSFYLSNNKNKKLVFIGDGSDQILLLLKKQVQNLGIENQVYFLGRKENPYKYLVKSKILALSSLYEGTPNVIAEAIALNIPIICSNCTAGIFEMMSFQKQENFNELILTESGIITPNFFKGNLNIPLKLDFIKEEEYFAIALDILENNYCSYSSNILINNKLLEKFNIDFVTNKYINN